MIQVNIGQVSRFAREIDRLGIQLQKVTERKTTRNTKHRTILETRVTKFLRIYVTGRFNYFNFYFILFILF